MRKATLILLSFILPGFVMGLSAAHAEVITYSFEANLISTDDGANAPTGSYYDQAAALSAISGVLQFDTDQLSPSGSSSTFQAYVGPIDILLDQFSTENPDLPINLSSVVDNTLGNGGDQFGGNYDGPISNGDGFYNTVSFQFFDDTGAAFSDQSLPRNMSLSDFTSLRVYVSTLYYDDNSGQRTVSTAIFSLTSLARVVDPSAVPVPAAFVFFVTGAAGLFLSRRKKRQAQSHLCRPKRHRAPLEYSAN